MQHLSLDEQLDHIAATLTEGAASLCADGSPVQLPMTLAVPADDVVFGVVAARSADIVAQACRRAGIAPQRLTATLDARIAESIIGSTDVSAAIM